MSLPVTGGLPGSSSFICHISRPSNLGQCFYYIAARAVLHPTEATLAPRCSVAISETAKRRRNIFAESDQLATSSKLHPAGAERFFVSMQPRFGARRSTPSGPTFAALWCHSPSRRRRRPFQRGRIDQPVAFSRGWSLSADAFEDREGQRGNCNHADTYALAASMLIAEMVH